MSSRACRQTVLVREHESPNPIGQPAFQTTHGLVMGLAGYDLRVVVGPTGALAHAYLGERDDVQREVELPITTAWQTVSRVVAAGDLDRCDAGIAGERGGAAEPARTTNLRRSCPNK